jgi:hypothetical protein
LINGFGAFNVQRVFFLVLGFVASLVGVVMFMIRGGPSGGTPPSHTFFLWERSFFMAAVILTAIGFVLLEGRLQNTDGRVLARTGATRYLIAGILLVTAEAFRMSLGGGFEKRAYALFVIYVVLAFLAQATMGGFAPMRSTGCMDRLGYHRLEPGVAGRAFRDHAGGHLLSHCASNHAPPYRWRVAMESPVTSRLSAAESGPSSPCPYSPKCLEGAFYEVRL